MAVIGGDLAYYLLKRVAGNSGALETPNNAAYSTSSKLEVLLGQGFWDDIQDKVVVDFGCGNGEYAVEMAKRGAKKVYGVDIREECLERGRGKAMVSGLSDTCEFVEKPPEPVDVIVSIDAFEHFEDPQGVLEAMRGMLKPDGVILASFGPTWYHPYGGHLFSVFPWAHLVISEGALIRWRSDFKSDGATRFHEVAGGLNQMTLRRFERIVANSPFRFENFDPVPIRKLKWLANRATREFTTSIVRCTLRPKD